MRFQLAAGREFSDAGAHAVSGGDVVAQQRVPGDQAVDGVTPSVARVLFGCSDNGLRSLCHFDSGRWVGNHVQRCHNDNECQSASCQVPCLPACG
jgi:hypothetical protein